MWYTRYITFPAFAFCLLALAVSLWKLKSKILTAILLVVHVLVLIILYAIDRLVLYQQRAPLSPILNKVMVSFTTALNCAVMITMGNRNSVYIFLTPGWGKILSFTGIAVLTCVGLAIIVRFSWKAYMNELTQYNNEDVEYMKKLREKTYEVLTSSIGVAFTLFMVSINLEVKSSSINDNLLTGTVALMFGGLWGVIHTIFLEHTPAPLSSST